MNQLILHKEIQHFINENLHADISKLLFKGSRFEYISIQELVAQIESKKRSEKKLPSWFKTKNIYYPNKLNIEQTSSEKTARYKSKLVSGTSLIDLTGGFGIDAFYFSKQIKSVIHCEINAELSKIVAHNYEQLGVSNIQVIAENGLTYLQKQQKQQKQFDWIYLDPSRRNDSKGKVFLLADCLPNVPQHLDQLFEFTNNILVKSSPMLDISKAIEELKFVKEVHVIALDNEVKELLFVLDKSYTSSILLKTCNLSSTADQLFEANYKALSSIEFALPKKYLYEPNAAILKAGLFNELERFTVFKLHQNSHLYTSDVLVDFPGRRFVIQHCIPYNRKELLRFIPSKKANITTRNFPETVAQIRKKTKLKDGGDLYLFFTTNLEDKHIVIICSKV